MTAPFSNQATPKYLGFVYQVLIALEKCFDAKKNQTIWIECFGDIYDGTKSIEVKHHLSGGGLNSNSVDFWKTLKNIVIEDTSNFGEFTLHTTQHVPKNSIFHNWNTLTPTKKYNLLKNHKPSDTALPYYKEAMKLKRKELLPILKMLNIISSQIQVKDFWDGLSNHRYLTSIDEEYREDAVKWLHGYINTKAVDEPYYWHININDFDEDFRIYSKKFKTGKIPFPYVDADLVKENGASTFIFLTELEDIGIKSRARANATSDYLRANISELELMKKRPSLMAEAIAKYEKNVKEKCNRFKDSEFTNLEETDLNTKQAHSASVRAYQSFQLSSIINIDHIDNTEHYFMAGKVHNSVENKSFSWKFDKEDIE